MLVRRILSNIIILSEPLLCSQVQYQPQTQQDYQYQQSQASSNNSAPCQYELQQFLHCTQSQPDITLCDAFNQVFKVCKMRNGIA